MITRKKTIIIMLALTIFASFILSACGKEKLNGYYIHHGSTESDKDEFLMEIDDDVVYYHEYHISSLPGSDKHLKGGVEDAEEGIDVYFVDAYDKFSPLHAKTVSDGNLLYFSSDNTVWLTDAYEKISKKDYEEEFDRVFQNHKGDYHYIEDYIYD